MSTPAPVLFLTGPTAAGKSAAVAALAQRWPVEIINVDSATIYRGMDIGTAKPGPDERRRLRHHLLDILDPAQSYSAAAFRDDALGLVADIRERGRIPVLCGGTLLYGKALADGLAQLPSSQPAIRAAIEARALQEGWPVLHQALAQIDPQTAARLAPRDRQRIQRALEVYYSSGRSLSAWLAQARQHEAPGLALRIISLEPSERAALHSRIATRFHGMLEQGLMDEIHTLHARPDLHPDLPAMRCVGYRQMLDFAAGRVTQAQAVEQAIAATRQLAKRQLTWLRGLPDRSVIDCLSPVAVDRVVDAVASFKPG